MMQQMEELCRDYDVIPMEERDTFGMSREIVAKWTCEMRMCFSNSRSTGFYSASGTVGGADREEERRKEEKAIIVAPS